MESLRKRLPPTKALVVFEASARHLSFTRAAEELHLTQAAVSRQIRVLEQNLGVLLFSRERRALNLTPEGERLKRTVTMALGHIADIAVALRQSRKDPHVNLHTTTAFGALWLMRRIGRFREVCPDVQLRVVSSDDEIDPGSGNIDLSIRYGEGNWPGLEATRLLGDELFPVCSPDFKKRLPADFCARDLPTQPLLHQEAVEPTWMSWSTWFRHMGIETDDRAPRATSFNNYLVILQAAQQGQGIALGWRRLVQPFVDSGQLVRPVPETLEADNAYYLLVEPGSLERSGALRGVHDWLLEEAALDGRECN
ncbi:MAG: LysR substrate-binding domain-containing protein [Arenicellales bacterium]|jgi:DNA-binding transcriptional LysR family regulator